MGLILSSRSIIYRDHSYIYSALSLHIYICCVETSTNTTHLLQKRTKTTHPRAFDEKAIRSHHNATRERLITTHTHVKKIKK